MKAYWADRPVEARPDDRATETWTGVGFVRLDRLVVAPAIAVTGDPAFTFALLEEPGSGAWYGEDAAAPGSALVPLDPSAVVPATARTEAALAEAARRSRATREELATRTARETEARFRSRALRVAGRLQRPEPGAMVIDLGRAALGRMPPPATWRRRGRIVDLTSVPRQDDPHGWVEQWESDEDLLVADEPAARSEVARLARSVRDGGGSRTSRIEAAARQAALAYLAEAAPDLVELAGVV
jgi:hypothetical protein